MPDLFLHNFSKARKKEQAPEVSETFRIFCWNLCNPSIERAKKQAAWLQRQPIDVFCLTETKDSEGCNFIERYFRARGFFVDFPKPEDGGYGAMIASRHPIKNGFLFVPDISPRINSVRVQGFEIVNTYVPNDREKGKQKFVENLLSSLENAPKPLLFLGDLNVIEPDHVPRYSKFEDWEYNFYRNLSGPRLHLRDAFRLLYPKANEYSWLGRTGDGYRYDHCFVSEDLVSKLRECYYLHEPRINRLSDHSGLVAKISVQ